MNDAPSETSFHAVIVAAGRGVRAGGGLPKQFRPLAGVPVLTRTVALFAAHPDCRRLIVVAAAEEADRCRALLSATRGVEIVPGGSTRQASVRAGLEVLAEEPEDAVVLIHDAARPFATGGLLGRVAAAAAVTGAAVPVLPVVDTLKQVTEDGRVAATVPRDPLRRAQTPQGFRLGPLLSAHRAGANGPEATDDAALMEAGGHAVATVEGETNNMKLTTESDFHDAERRLAPLWETRTGMGYDVHRFGPGDGVWLFGLKIPHDKTLQGHSDADVGLHAITDALLGAVAEGDIGTHFPPSDPQWRGAASDRFLAHARDLVLAKGGRILSVDATAICERPKLGPHREALRARVAEILGLSVSRVSLKATTTEKLGFTGRGEGIACQAVATVALPPDLPPDMPPGLPA